MWTELIGLFIIIIYMSGFVCAFNKLIYKYGIMSMFFPVSIYIFILSMGSWITFLYEVIREKYEKDKYEQ